jgi:hypothetical protein
MAPVGADALTDGDPGHAPQGPEAAASGELGGGYARQARESSGKGQRWVKASLAPRTTNAAANPRRSQARTEGRDRTWSRIRAAKRP